MAPEALVASSCVTSAQRSCAGLPDATAAVAPVAPEASVAYCVPGEQPSSVGLPEDSTPAMSSSENPVVLLDDGPPARSDTVFNREGTMKCRATCL